MAGKKGQKWAEKKAKFPMKFNTAVTKEVGNAIQEEATKDQRSASAIIRKVLDKFFG